MKRNIGILDSITRIVLAISVSVAAIYGIITGTHALWGMGIAAFLLITSFIRHCPLYSAFGISTRKKQLTNRPFRVLRSSW